ncbi:MAG TPA: phytanoyl-CoA dioxygenase family protein, partial [Micropepsaceae bacterium]|nr:phytanoyl-CoA dioxygenase family protein [Micropepsaceae bacterium]
EQVEQYRRDGFVSPVRMISPMEAVDARRELEAMEAAAGGSLRGIARTKFYLRYPWAYRLATHPAILDAVEDLIGPDILLYQNTIWAKNAGEETHVSWHQDNTYFGHVPCEVLSVWLALSPSRPESGSMRFLAGSHRLGQLPVRYEVTDGNMLSSGQVTDFDLSKFDAVATSLEPGEASIHHAFLIHGSPPNKSRDRRLGITFVYHPPSLRQLGELPTSAMLVRGQDRYGNFASEEPPLAADDPETIARHERGAALYRAKAEELGNRTITRHDPVKAPS